MTGYDFHKKAEELREKDNHTEALKMIDEAIVAYQKEQNYSDLSEVLQSRVLTYKYLFLLTKGEVFALLAKKDAEVSLEITQKYNVKDGVGSCYFRLGKIAMLFEDYKLAAENYQKALDNYTGSNSERGDYRYHLGTAFGKLDQLEKAKEIMLKGLSEIQENKGEVDLFLTHVWESGCYMRLVELLKESEPESKQRNI